MKKYIEEFLALCKSNCYELKHTSGRPLKEDEISFLMGAAYMALAQNNSGVCSCEYCGEHWGLGIYDDKFGNDRVCKCEHSYYRHFDSYDNMRAIGCKYCQCGTFRLRK